MGGLLSVSRFASWGSAATLQRNPALPLMPATSWQQTRHGSFFNKLTADDLWKGVMAEAGAGGKKGRGKRAKRKFKKDLNRAQSIGDGAGGFLWPGLNIRMEKDGVMQPFSQRSQSEQQKITSERTRWRDDWVRRKMMKKRKERGWTGHSMGGLSLGPPDPGPDGETYDDFDSCIIEFKAVFNMTSRDGRKRTISCLVAVGNGKGIAGFAIGKSGDRRSALRKAKNRALRFLYYIERYNDHTIYHDINSSFKRTALSMKKQNKGYGLRCHRAIITICKLIGIKDMYCKVHGSTNLLNITKALFNGLVNQQTHQNLADEQQLHVVEFKSECGPLPFVVASPQNGVRLDPKPKDEILDIPLEWKDIKDKQEGKKSIWSNVKRTIW
ncbi:small ribosomal subunit protein uS5m [Aulostomus maculatus]